MFYLIYDPDPKDMKHFSKQTYSLKEAQQYNKGHYGVFITPNEFNGMRRLSNLSRIKFFMFEIDSISKKEQGLLIKASPLKPSLIIESKNSYHVYFRLDKGEFCSLDDYHLVQCGLISHFQSDPKIKDATRLMRAPGFYHLKDPSDPFMVKKAFESDLSYTVKEMREAFPYTPPPRKELKVEEDFESKESFLKYQEKAENFNSLDSLKALSQLSGTSFVNYEIYSFRRTANGNYNIVVNGEQTSCFIDKNGMIGATHGPTVWQWLKYFGHSDSDVGRIINNVFGV